MYLAASIEARRASSPRSRRHGAARSHHREAPPSCADFARAWALDAACCAGPEKPWPRPRAGPEDAAEAEAPGPTAVVEVPGPTAVEDVEAVLRRGLEALAAAGGGASRGLLRPRASLALVSSSESEGSYSDDALSLGSGSDGEWEPTPRAGTQAHALVAEQSQSGADPMSPQTSASPLHSPLHSPRLLPSPMHSPRAASAA